MTRTLCKAILAALASGALSVAGAADLKPEQQALFDIYKELVEINTTDSVGDNTQAARAMAARLTSAGFPQQDVQVLVPSGNAKKGNLVARLRGTGGGKPLLLVAHLDVVEAHKEDWSADLDPFKLTERDGYYYGRGTADDKAMAAIFVANLIRYKQEGLKPRRDIILALTADEEGGDFNGVSWLADEHRELIDAEFGLNEGGGGRERAGKKLFNAVQATEKLYRDFDLEITNKGGHSSVPVPDNAIYRLAAALDRLSKFSFPVNLNEVTHAFFERTAALEGGELGAAMKAVVESNGKDAAAAAKLAETAAYNSMLRTTCVATMLQAGHARNALPQKATANVNCRILPQESVEDVQRTLVRVFADEGVKVTLRSTAGAPAAPVSPLDAKVMKPIEQLTAQKWKGVTVIPIMGTGATDSAYLRAKGIPMYGVSGLFGDIADVRAHGRDERVGAAQLYDSQDFLYRLVKQYATVPATVPGEK
ncbi:MAG TPA: M20/M25/M40 family metallo-hydrolase [Steroidobacteraceae bacterium]|nr:M20/M25/M40 family metallo-hydrolase [Steroidobacteraceae bacterium]